MAVQGCTLLLPFLYKRPTGTINLGRCPDETLKYHFLCFGCFLCCVVCVVGHSAVDSAVNIKKKNIDFKYYLLLSFELAACRPGSDGERPHILQPRNTNSQKYPCFNSAPHAVVYTHKRCFIPFGGVAQVNH